MAGDTAERWDGLRSTFAPRPEPPDPKRAEKLREAVDEAAGHARGQTYLLLSATLYIAILSATTTHHMLLVGGTIQMPILNIGASITVAYTVAPVLYVVLHLSLLRSLLSVSRRIDEFEAALRPLAEPEQGHQRALVNAFFFVEWRAGRRYGRGDRLLALAVNWLIFVAFPVVLLLWMQLRFLPYQHEVITPIHVACVWVDLTLLWWMWPEINGPRRSRPATIAGVVGTACASSATLLLLYDQHHDYLAWADRFVPAPVAATFDYRFSRLRVSSRILMTREPAPEIVAQFRQEAGSGKGEEGERRAYLDPELAEPLSLNGRNLRRASFARSKLWRADLGGADLRDADLPEVQLQGALLYQAKIHGSDLRRARLQGANLLGVGLEGADLTGAHLHGADLSGARLQGASLSGARLQGANFYEARLQGADLQGAQLQGANLNGARLQGANLSGAKLQGAILSWARLQGADLRNAELYGAVIDETTFLSHVDLRSGSATPLAPSARAELTAEIEQAILAPEISAGILARLKAVLDASIAAWTVRPLPEARRKDMIASEDLPEAFRKLTNNQILLSSRDDMLYYKMLSEELTLMVCQAKDEWITKGVVKRMKHQQESSSFVPTLAGRLLAECPDLIVKLDATDHRFLAAAAAMAVPGGAVETP